MESLFRSCLKTRLKSPKATNIIRRARIARFSIVGYSDAESVEQITMIVARLQRAIGLVAVFLAILALRIMLVIFDDKQRLLSFQTASKYKLNSEHL